MDEKVKYKKGFGITINDANWRKLPKPLFYQRFQTDWVATASFAIINVCNFAILNTMSAI